MTVRIGVPVIETTLAQMRQRRDWQEVFASAGVEEHSGNTGGVPAGVPGYTGSLAVFSRDDVAEVIASVDGENEGSAWVCIVRLRDGRFAALEGSCDYTGWDCRAGASCVVAATLEDVIRFGVSKPECGRLGIDVPDESAARGADVAEGWNPKGTASS